MTPFKKRGGGVGPHLIHLRVQHIPLMNLMGLRTFFFEVVDHFLPLGKTVGGVGPEISPSTIRGTEEVHNRHLVPLRAPPPPHQNPSVPIIPIPGQGGGRGWAEGGP